jgi:hypothetical protein
MNSTPAASRAVLIAERLFVVLCTTFCVLEDKIDAFYSTRGKQIASDTERNVALIRLRSAQNALLPRIQEIHAETLDGALARVDLSCEPGI